VEPDWIGDPKHFVAGAILAAFVVLLSPRFSIQSAWIAAALAVGVTMTAEAIVELVEYPLMYRDDPNLTAYYDTLADLATTLAGAVVGATLGTIGYRRFIRT
jgi:cell shape-determining protein MreD